MNTWIDFWKIAWLAVLPLEILGLTWRHDTGHLSNNTQWWAAALGEAHYLPALAVTSLLCVIIFGGERVGRSVSQFWSATRSSSAPAWLWLILHIACYWLFDRLCLTLLDPQQPSTNAGGGLFLLGVAVSGLLVLTWARTLTAWANWYQLLLGLRGILLITFVLAGLAFASSRMTESMWSPLANVTLSLVQTLLQVCLPNVLCDPITRTIGSERFLVEIAPSCSGYEGLGLVGAVITLFLIYRRDELLFPQALMVLPAALLLTWSLNLARIVGLILLGHAGWPDVAQGGFHSQAGWIIFNGVALGAVAFTLNCRWICKTVRHPESSASWNPAAPYLLPLVTVVGTSLLTSAFVAEGLDRWYGLRLVTGFLVVWLFRTQLRVALGAFPKSVAVWCEVLFVGHVVFVLWIGLSYLLNGSAASPRPAELDQWPAWASLLWLGLRIAGSVLIVPLAEELAFRGYLYRRLQASEFDQVPLTKFAWLAALGSSAIFGLLHPGHEIAGILAGLAYLGLMRRRGSIWEATLAHACTNALLAVYVLMTDSWKLL